MSTYFGYECRSHEPALGSERWFNWGNEVLTETFVTVRQGNWPQVTVRSDRTGEVLWTEDAPVRHSDHETAAPISWLRDHPNCEVWLVNEYGPKGPPEVHLNDLLKTIEAPPKRKEIES